MTAVNFVLQPDRLHVFADGAGYNAAGVFTGPVSKIHVIPHMPAVMTARGGTLAANILSLVIRCHFSTFDDLVESFADEVRDLFDMYQSRCDPDGETETGDVVIGGFLTSRNRIELYATDFGGSRSNDEAIGEAKMRVQLEVGAMTSLGDGSYSAPGLTTEQMIKGFGTASILTIALQDIDRFARTTLELQREQLLPSPDGSDPLVSAVGSHAELVTLTKDGISSRIIHRWPDVVGEKMRGGPRIDWARWRKNGNEPEAISTSGLSRLQREMAERKARKAERRGVVS